jgi:hypothetical protein
MRYATLKARCDNGEKAASPNAFLALEHDYCGPNRSVPKADGQQGTGH